MSAARVLWSVGKTTVFLIGMWGVFLFAVPIGISIVEVDVGIQRFPPQLWLASPMLIVFTFLVVWAAMSLAVAGDGTPTEFDPTRKLVTSGPYAYLRHPFAAGVTGQIVALGIALGSVPVIAYAALALTVWYYVIRPREERALGERFGQSFEEYRARVRGFRPTFR